MKSDYIQSMLESKDFDFENENVASFDFSGRDLRCANFKNVNLYNANFEGCDLRRAVFKDAYVTDANFKNAILLGVDFTECNIEDALWSYRRSHVLQVISFTAPTGAGKTIIIASLIENIYFGDEKNPEHPASGDAGYHLDIKKYYGCN